MKVAGNLQSLAKSVPAQKDHKLEFQKISWEDNILLANGLNKGRAFSIALSSSDQGVGAYCSICSRTRICPHVSTLLGLLHETGIADEIEANGFKNCSYALTKKSDGQHESRWKSQLARLTEDFRWYSTNDRDQTTTFPANREVIYILQQSQHYYDNAGKGFRIQLATRQVDPTNVKPDRKSTGPMFKNFSGGAARLALSDDPLDREVAQLIAFANANDSSYSQRSLSSFFLNVQTSADLVRKMSSAGRLYLNTGYTLTDEIVPLAWLSDERFELKFEIAAVDERSHLNVGGCAANSQMSIPMKQIRKVNPTYFIDNTNRLGLFNRSIPELMAARFSKGEDITVPRRQAGELIEKLLALPIDLGIEFKGCDDIRPQRLEITPRPLIHIKAPAHETADVLYADASFDYEGIKVPLHARVTELYDKQRSAMIKVDHAFHRRSIELLSSIGVKISQQYGAPSMLTLRKSKLPSIVMQLIHHGWHVEADGKLYRSGSRFEMSVESGIDWFELNGTAHFDQTSIDLPRLLSALRSGEKTVVLDDGSIGLIPEEWVKRFTTVADLGESESGTVRFGKSQVGMLDALLAQQGDINVDEKFAAARQSLREFDQISPIEPPAGFVGTLRPYQKLAQGWFAFLRNLGFGGCLADDMGLGKTVQVLALLEQRRQEKCGPSLIVVPRSLVFNWTAEAKKFAPDLRVLDQSHSQRTRGTDHLSDFDLVISTYGTLRRDAAFIKDFQFDYVVLDEAQAIKNAGTEAAKAVRLLNGRHKLALSGTPIENHLGELWSLFDFLNPGMLGRIGRFTNLATDANADDRKLLAAVLKPFILRRTKKQVAPELPDRVEQTIIVQLDPEQRKAYNELRDFYRQSLLKKIETDGIRKSQIVILEALLRLRQAACHPGLIDKTAIEQPSAKLDELMSRLESATESGERVLVFSQFTSFLAIVRQRLDKSGIDYLYLDGKTRKRFELVETFQSGTGPSIFLISLKAGGVGLNLTAARTVYLLDPWWNPAVEAQAIDRSHRIGQQQTVFAARLIAADTVEQKVLELQAKKKGLADAIVNADNSGISSLTKEDLELLLA